MTYNCDADDIRWEREQERRMDCDYRPRRKRGYRCGGYASPTGHCGAIDCDRCHPGCSTCPECGGDIEDGRCVECGEGEDA